MAGATSQGVAFSHGRENANVPQRTGRVGRNVTLAFARDAVDFDVGVLRKRRNRDG
jgi:hypothetical protein